MSQVRDNRAESRFELEENGLVAFADYVLAGVEAGMVYRIDHVEAPPALRGKGSAGRLMEGLLALIRAEGAKVQPICPYAVHYINRRAEHRDLLG